MLGCCYLGIVIFPEHLSRIGSLKTGNSAVNGEKLLYIILHVVGSLHWW